MNRREFIRGSVATAVLASAQISGAQDAAPRLRAAIIGHTGRGNYGHDLDVVFNGLENVEVVGVVDPDEKGRVKAAVRSKALRQYADYKEMLRIEKPQLVSVAPRWTDQHFAMAKAALEAGAHILVEKPFTSNLAEADELLALAAQRKLKIAVAHQMRLSPGIVELKRKVSDGFIGELVKIRTWGKQDKRAGGEDMVVLGTHVFDMVRLFAGDAIGCSAEVWQGGERITRKHRPNGSESVGPVAGDEIEAQFYSKGNVSATFTSRARLRETLGPWGVELVGTKRVARILMDIDPRIYVLNSGQWDDAGKTEKWERFDRPAEKGFAAANKRVVEDWLAAIRDHREPQCSGHAGMKALEMVMAVYESALTGKRVELPLKNRKHPLA